jgi:hypothetical protein
LFIDPLFALSTFCYAGNRWLLKPRVHSPFLRYWFNDLLLVPCAIPVLFWLFRALGLREGAARPRAVELAWILVVWSLLFEVFGPSLVRGATGDWRDVLMYWTGGIAAWAFWKYWYSERASG